MFCPRCGQERVSRDTSFCSQCGFLLTAAAELLLTDGVLDPDSALRNPHSAIILDSPRARGVKFGIFMMLLTLFVAPIVGMIAVFALGIGRPWPVGLAILLLAGGGFLRIIHALMFESKQPGAPTLREQRWARWNNEENAPVLSGAAATQSGPGRQLNEPAYDSPLSTLHSQLSPAPGRWLDTKDLEPRSVTEQTTRQLSKEQDFSE